MVETEGLELAGSVSRISNLLKAFEHESPRAPRNPPIWHWIWHWPRRLRHPDRCVRQVAQISGTRVVTPTLLFKSGATAQFARH